jgi:hypothetical protein
MLYRAYAAYKYHPLNRTYSVDEICFAARPARLASVLQAVQVATRYRGESTSWHPARR